MDVATWSQIQDKTVCILHIAKTLGEGLNQTILPQAVGEQQGRQVSLIFV